MTLGRIVPYAMFPWQDITDAEAARKWVQEVNKEGAQVVRLHGGTLEAQTAVYQETEKQKMGTANHHNQRGVFQVSALTSAQLGLDSLEHWYGLPEALFTDRTIQDYPPDYNYSDEQWRFAQAGRLWRQAAMPGSKKWNAVRDELVALNLTLVPTFTICEANRDVA